MEPMETKSDGRRRRAGVLPRVSGENDVKEAILNAARGCFFRYGVGRTTMEDVANEAGIPRQYLYRFFSGREELVTAVASARFREIIDGLRPVLAKPMTLTETLL